MTEELTVGRLVNTHGIRGEIKVLSHTDFPDVRFAAGKKLMVIPGDGSAKFEVTVESAREHKGMFIVKLKGYTNINEVEKYKGSLSIHKTQYLMYRALHQPSAASYPRLQLQPKEGSRRLQSATPWRCRIWWT